MIPGLFAFLVSVAYVPWWNGAAVTLRWAIMAVGAAALVGCSSRPDHSLAPPTIRKADAIGLAFLVWCVVSALWSPVFVEAANALMQFAILALLFVVGSRLESLRPITIGFGIGVAINSAIMLVQRLADHGLSDYFELNAGLFWNPNHAGEAAALGIVALASQRIWLLVATAWPSLVLSGSRAALVGICAAGAGWLWGRSRFGAALVVIVCLTSLTASVLVGHKAGGFTERIDLWRDVASGLTVFGHGIGSFWVDFPSHSTLMQSRPDHAHNDGLELFYELGIAAFLVLWFVGAIGKSAEPTERLVLIAFVVIAMVSYPLYTPATAFLIAVVAGHASRGSVELRWPLALRRMAVRWPAPRAYGLPQDRPALR